MQCSSCRTELPMGVAYCPTCGTVAPSRVSESGISPYDLTSASSPSGTPLYAPPPPPPRRQVKFGLITGAVVLVLALASIGVFALFAQRAASVPTSTQ